MTENGILFPELVAAQADPPPKPCDWPLFVVAYWPRGGYWAIKNPLQYSDPVAANLHANIRALQTAGWQHVTIMRLPPTGPWAQKTSNGA